MTRPVSDAQFRALARFRAALRRFLRYSEEAARAAGLTPQQHQALLAVRAAPAPPTIGDLAEQLQLKHHSVVGLVDRLAAQQLVERRAAADDRRRVLLALTPLGEKLLEGLSAAHRTELLRLAPALVAALGALEEG